jgi:hypothetical protein
MTQPIKIKMPCQIKHTKLIRTLMADRTQSIFQEPQHAATKVSITEMLA